MVRPLFCPQKNGVAAKSKQAFNENILVQHCSAHRLVLVAKDAQKCIPKFVESTIEDHFRFSPLVKANLSTYNHLMRMLTEIENPP